ncbi:MAG: CrcB family protein [Limosilactobacillus sp.]|uniref:fluoride efflux transporter FluC n=1 Tax=Limosilactobacillus sp. TaxID=2773925 RepID=UPI002700E44C|nr:CrcB family protein [Limosilactobacillus sp.]
MVLVGLGASIGAVLRLYLKKTLYINIVGAFLLALLTKHGITTAFLTVGILGGFTTFSTLKYELVTYYKDKDYVALLKYGLISYVGGILAAALGFWL